MPFCFAPAGHRRLAGSPTALRLDEFSRTLARLTHGRLEMTFMTDDGRPLFEKPVQLRALRVTLKVVGETPGESRKRLPGISMTADAAS